MNSNIDELKEKLACIEHERWADWQKYCNQKVRQVVPVEHLKEVEDLLLTHWERQIATPYAALSEREQASDMEQVDRYWPLIQQELLKARIDEISILRNGYGWGDALETSEYILDDRLADLQAKLKENSDG